MDPLCPLPSLPSRLTQGPRTQEKRKSGLGHQPVCYRFQPQDRVRKNCFLVMFCFFRSQQSRVTDPARGWLHTSCSQYLCRRWWPWLESTPVENWIPLASGELHLCKFSPEANPPSLGFTVLTSQLLLTHHSEWFKGVFFFFPLVSFMLGQHLAFSIFVDHKYSRVALTPAFAFIRERYQQARTELTPAPAKAIFTPPLLATHHDLSSNICSLFPYNFFILKKFFICWFLQIFVNIYPLV